MKFNIYLTRLPLLYSSKYLLGYKTYLNLLMPLHGLWFYVSEKKIIRRFTLILSLPVFGLITSLFVHQNLTSSVRCIQWILILGFTQWASIYFTPDNLQRLFNYIISLAYFLVPIEYFLSKQITIKHFLNLEFRSLVGLIGEPNYSGALISSIGLISLSFKWKRLYLLSFPLIILYFNRSGLLSIVLFSLIIFITPRGNSKLSQYTHILISIMFLSSPVIFYGLNKFLPTEIKQEIEETSNGRYHTYIGYTYVGLENPLGTGYFHEELIKPKYFLKKTNLRYLDGGFSTIQQHNTLIQVWSELGPIAYLIFCIFLWNTFKASFLLSHNLGFALQGVLFNYLFLNGLNEFAFNLFLGLAWNNQFKNRSSSLK